MAALIPSGRAYSIITHASAEDFQQPSVYINMVPYEAVKKWPSMLWTYHPGAIPIIDMPLTIINIRNREWRSAAKHSRRVPVRRTAAGTARAARLYAGQRPILIFSEPTHIAAVERIKTAFSDVCGMVLH